MNIELIKQGVTRFGGKSLLTIQKYAPEILTGAGIIALSGAGVLAAKKTLELPEITNEIDIAREDNREQAAQDINYATTQYAGVNRHIFFKGSAEIVKLYAVPVLLGTGGVICILSAHGMLRRRNAALAATVVTLTEALDSYRKRVADKIGEDEERELWLNNEKIIVEDEDGRPMALHQINPQSNPYGRWFDEGSTQFSRDPGQNARTLLTEQNYFNDRLKSRGYVFLNEVYKRLGLPESREGQIVGWWYDPKNPDQPDADDFVDFRIMNPEDPAARDFINGWNKVVWLDFNVQGPILDHMPKSKTS